ncbi:MAG TPA: SipW-dependent-type signal peptide-containing protein, partial [Tissierellaceae bacterium]
MNKRKKNILNITLLFVVFGMLLSTLAYFTSSDNVENKFTVGDININLKEPNFLSPGTMTPEELEKVKKDLKENENLTDEEIEDYLNEHRDNAHITPGKIIQKDPTVTVEANSEDSYVFAAVDNHITHVLEDIEIDPSWTHLEKIEDPNNSNRKLDIYVYTGSKAQDKVVPLNHEDL